jgi:hypothetical protein
MAIKLGIYNGHNNYFSVFGLHKECLQINTTNQKLRATVQNFILIY